MLTLHGEETLMFILQIGLLLGAAKFFGEVARYFKQPAVIGELFAGILIGPTILGGLFPELFNAIFVHVGNSTIALDGLFSLSVILLLFTVGVEVDLPAVIKQGKSVLWISLLGLAIPLLMGLGLGWLLYPIVESDISQMLFSLFIGAALSISALPVVARVLMDLGLLKTPTGSLIVAVATVNDIVGWIIFTIVLALSGKSAGHVGIATTVIATLLLTILSATIMRKIMDVVLTKLYTITKSSGAILGLILTMALFASALTEYLGVHAVFGAFLVGLSVSGVAVFSEDLRHNVNQFVGQVLAPLFFAAVGLKVNFLAAINIPLILSIIAVAYVSKLLAAYIGGKMSGMDLDGIKATGLGIAARGGMGIILAVIASKAGLIDNELFTALIIMALVTTITAGMIGKYVKVPTLQA